MSVILAQTMLTTGYTVKMMDSTFLTMLKKSTSQSTSPYLEDVLHQCKIAWNILMYIPTKLQNIQTSQILIQGMESMTN